jgi:glycosyltransferase involved in cell wall biosynthesis
MITKHFHPYPGGVETRALELGRYLAARGQEITVLTSREPNTQKTQEKDKILIRRSTPLLSIFNTLLAPGILYDLLTLDYDLIDLNLPDPLNSIWALIASIIRGKPLIATYHADIIRSGPVYAPFLQLYNPLQHLLLKRCARIIVTSNTYARESKTLAAHMNKTVVASNFIDPKKYNTRIPREKAREKLGLQKPTILFVGRLVPYKGLHNLIAAASTLPDADFLIVGEGPLEKNLKEQAQKIGARNVRFEGKADTEMLPAYYRAADILALPSVTRQEAFGIVLVEAMASGTPVISTNFSGMPYVIGDSGLLVNPENPGELAAAIRKLLSDENLRVECSIKGLRRVEERFTVDAVGEIVWRVYKESATNGLRK